MNNRLPLILRLSAGASLLIAIGVALMWLAGISVWDVKREFRLALGLPKFWNKDFNADVSRNVEETCPNQAIVIVTGGQSNAANAYDPAPSGNNGKNTFMFYSGHCFRLQSPVLGASGSQDSLWPALGRAIEASTGKAVVFINGAVGGSQIGDWLDDRSGYAARLSREIRLAKDVGLRTNFVLWIQGETDAAVGLDPQLYAHQQKAVVDKLDTEGGLDDKVPWVVYLSTRCLHRKSNGTEIEQALRALSSTSNASIMIGPSITAYDDTYRHDTCHLNTRGRDRLVQESLANLQRYSLLDLSK